MKVHESEFDESHYTYKTCTDWIEDQLKIGLVEDYFFDVMTQEQKESNNIEFGDSIYTWLVKKKNYEPLMWEVIYPTIKEELDGYFEDQWREWELNNYYAN